MIGSSNLNILNGSVTVPANFIGVHFKGTPVSGQGKHMHAHDMQGCRWWEVNTSAGVYNWTTLDAKVAAWGSGPWTYCCFGTPTWASARPAESHPYGLGRMAEPASMTSLSDFVTALVTRYPTLTHIEVWNEPDLASPASPPYWYSGTVATFVTMCTTISAAAKAANPAITVLGPGSVYYLSSPNWLDAFFAAGGATPLDAISMHGYQLQWATPHKALLGVLLQLQYTRAAMSKAGVSKPIYVSELGQINPLPATFTDDELIASYKRAMIVAAAIGAQTANWYQYDDTTFGYSSRPAVVSAVAAFCTQLCGAVLSAVSLKIPDMTVTATIAGTTVTV